jgi:hypothetical protein
MVPVCPWDFSQIVSGPDEFVSLIDNHPRRIVVQSKVKFHCRRKLDRSSRISRRPMCDRQDRNDQCAVGDATGTEHDYAGSIFAALFLPGSVFVVPKIGKV